MGWGLSGNKRQVHRRFGRLYANKKILVKDNGKKNPKTENKLLICPIDIFKAFQEKRYCKVISLQLIKMNGKNK